MSSLTFLTTAFVFSLVFLSTGFEYWQSRKNGLSQDASIHDAAVAGGFLTTSAVIAYVVTILA